MRLFIHDVTIYMKSGNVLRSHMTDLKWTWSLGKLTNLKWEGSDGVSLIDPEQVEAIQSRRVLNWRRAFRG